MRKALIAVVEALVLTIVLTGNASNANAATLTFDDISASVIGTIPDGYGGLQWDAMGFIDGGSFYVNSGYENGAVSGAYTAFNEFAAVATAGGTTFDFTSAYLTAAWNDGLSVTVTGLLGGSPLYTQTVVVNTSGPTLFNFNYLGIDELTFASAGGTNAGLDAGGEHFAMDNFTYNLAAVPDSGSSLLLLGLGLMATVVLLAGKL